MYVILVSLNQWAPIPCWTLCYLTFDNNMNMCVLYILSKTKLIRLIKKTHILTQVDDSGRRTLQKRCGKVTGSCRKTPEIAETWKQYSDRKLSGFCPADSCQLSVLSGRNRAKSIGKNPKIFRPEYCFHKITGITGNQPFSSRTVRPGNNQSLMCTTSSFNLF